MHHQVADEEVHDSPGPTPSPSRPELRQNWLIALKAALHTHATLEPFAQVETATRIVHYLNVSSHLRESGSSRATPFPECHAPAPFLFESSESVVKLFSFLMALNATHSRGTLEWIPGEGWAFLALEWRCVFLLEELV